MFQWMQRILFYAFFIATHTIRYRAIMMRQETHPLISCSLLVENTMNDIHKPLIETYPRFWVDRRSRISNFKQEDFDMNKFTIIIATVLCLVIIGLSTFKNCYFNKDKRLKDSIERQRDYLIQRQIVSQDSLIKEIKKLNSLLNEYKLKDTTIQADIKQIIYYSNKSLKLQKQVLRKIK